MALPTHGRFDYAAIGERPPFRWPDGKRLAVYLAVGIEHFGYGEGGLGLPYSPGLDHPNTYNWAWREYGNRVGGWRLLELMNQHQLTPTVLLNTACYEHCPQLLDAYRAAGAEMVAHGYTNSTHPNGLGEDEERELLASVAAEIAAREGQPPGGWMSPGSNPRRVTEDLLAEVGYRYTLDWPLDDQPTWLSTRGGPLLSVPYPHEINDVPAIALHHLDAAGFADMVIGQIDEMLEQAEAQPLACGIVIHTFIVGQPYRLREFRRVAQHLAGLRDRIWLTTPGAIATTYAEQHPAA